MSNFRIGKNDEGRKKGISKFKDIDDDFEKRDRKSHKKNRTKDEGKRMHRKNIIKDDEYPE